NMRCQATFQSVFTQPSCSSAPIFNVGTWLESGLSGAEVQQHFAPTTFGKGPMHGVPALREESAQRKRRTGRLASPRQSDVFRLAAAMPVTQRCNKPMPQAIPAVDAPCPGCCPASALIHGD